MYLMTSGLQARCCQVNGMRLKAGLQSALSQCGSSYIDDEEEEYSDDTSSGSGAAVTTQPPKTHKPKTHTPKTLKPKHTPSMDSSSWNDGSNERDEDDIVATVKPQKKTFRPQPPVADDNTDDLVDNIPSAAQDTSEETRSQDDPSTPQETETVEEQSTTSARTRDGDSSAATAAVSVCAIVASVMASVYM